MLENYLAKITSEKFDDRQYQRHKSIYELLCGELRNQIKGLQTVAEEKLIPIMEDSGKQKKGHILESTSDYANIVKEITQWFRFAKEKFGISVGFSRLDAHRLRVASRAQRQPETRLRDGEDQVFLVRQEPSRDGRRD